MFRGAPPIPHAVPIQPELLRQTDPPGSSWERHPLSDPVCPCLFLPVFYVVFFLVCGPTG